MGFEPWSFWEGVVYFLRDLLQFVRFQRTSWASSILGIQVYFSERSRIRSKVPWV